MTLHALSPEAMKNYSDRLVALFAEGDAFHEIWRADGMALMEMKDGQPVPTSKVHFGYTDGISMTTHSRRSGTISTRITNSHATRGYSFCRTRLRITCCPSPENSV